MKQALTHPTTPHNDPQLLEQMISFLQSQIEFNQSYIIHDNLPSSPINSFIHVTHNTTQKPALLHARLETKNDFQYGLDHEINQLRNHFSYQYHRIVQLIDSYRFVYHEAKCLFLVAYTIEPILYTLHDIPTPFSLKTIALQGIDMLQQYHSSHHVHCNITPQHIGVRSATPHLDICLMNLSTSICISHHSSGISSTQGSPEFMSINMERTTRITYADDLESFGYVLWWLKKKALPWSPQYHIHISKEERIQLKQNLSGAPRRIKRFILACRHHSNSKPNYTDLLILLGLSPHHMLTPYISTTTTFTHYHHLNSLHEFDGIKDNDEHKDILNEHDLTHKQDLSRLLHKHHMSGNDPYTTIQHHLQHIGIPLQDAIKFTRFMKLYC
jgi:hypothetical protein